MDLFSSPVTGVLGQHRVDALQLNGQSSNRPHGRRTRVERRADEQLRAGLVVDVLHGDAHRQRDRPPHPLVQLREQVPVRGSNSDGS